MKHDHLILGTIAIIIASNSWASPGNGRGQGPRDVNVINTPNVVVTNPQTSVSIDNTSESPVPVRGTVSLDLTTPLPVEVKNASGASYQFIGYSSSPIDTPRVGYQSELCRDTFGDAARWATTQEVREAFESGSFTQLPPVIATVRANYSHALWDVNHNRSVFYDPDAGYRIIDPGCASNNRSIVITPEGRFNEGPCWATAYTIVAACSMPR